MRVSDLIPVHIHVKVVEVGPIEPPPPPPSQLELLDDKRDTEWKILLGCIAIGVSWTLAYWVFTELLEWWRAM